MNLDWWGRVRKAGRYFSTDFVARAAVFATLVYAARTLGPTEFGKFALVYTAAQVAGLLADMGLSTLLLRRGARGGRMYGPSFWTAVSLKLVASVATSACLVGAFLALYPAGAAIAAVYAPTVILLTATMSIESVAIAASRPDLVGGSRLAGNGCVLVLTVVLLAIDRSPELVAVAFLGGGIVKACWILCAVRDVVPVATARRRLTLPLLRKAAPFYGSALAVFLYQRVDVLMLGALASVAVAGQYVAAYRVLDGVLLLPAAVCAAFLPSWAARRPDGSPGSAQSVVLLLGCIGVLVGIELVLAGDFVIDILYGGEFDTSATILIVLALSVPWSYVNIALIWFAYIRQKEASVAALGVVALVCNISLNLALIRAFEGPGAAAATVVTEVLVSAAYIAMLGINSPQVRHRAGRLMATVCVYAGALITTVLLCVAFGVPWPVSAAACACAGAILLVMVYRREVSPLIQVRGSL